MPKEALHYRRGDVICLLCPHECRLKNGQTGNCKARTAIDGRLYSDNYGSVTGIGMDPVEKKPLYHFYPGSEILSIGTFGCNLHCFFCQNYSISQAVAQAKEIQPEDLADLLREYGGIGVAYTYSEPLIWYEFVSDCCRIVRKNGKKNVLVTNGFIKPEPLAELLPSIDAMNIDLKAFSDEFYRKHCGGQLAPVLETIRISAKSCHVELTNLVVTDLNDNEEEFMELVEFVAEIDREIPLHISRYHPSYNCLNPATSQVTLQRFYQIAKEKLQFVYLGNLMDKEASSTFCPGCGKMVVERLGYNVRNRLKGRNCPFCGTGVKGEYFG
ncbi:MAG: AmmeMemoRadiSam system radical SAM enzyme [Candidatus Wallbacteria bacterium]|nr:AmmeMemoRadiSam system radical SAM enzyme [Candidatus Wallbacteria bacterium]